jgi:hypothetical protein
MVGNYREATQLVVSGVALSSTELVTYIAVDPIAITETIKPVLRSLSAFT